MCSCPIYWAGFGLINQATTKGQGPPTEAGMNPATTKGIEMVEG